MTVFRPNEAPSGPSLTDREREVLDLIEVGRDEPRDRRAALPVAAHGEGAHFVAVPEAVGPQPRRGGAEGAAPRADHVSVPSKLGQASSLRVTSRGDAPARPRRRWVGRATSTSATGRTWPTRACTGWSGPRSRCSTAAWAGGVRHFDAARSYGHAEAILGGWLAARVSRRDDVMVSPKWGTRYTGGVARGRARTTRSRSSGRQLRRQWTRVVALLGDRGFDLYQIHSATVDSGVLDNAEVRADRRVWRRCPRSACRATGPAQASDDLARAGGRRVRRGAGDVEPARAEVRRVRSPAAADAGLERLRQGGAGERPPDRRVGVVALSRPREAGRRRGSDRAGGGARTAVGGCGAERRDDGGAAGEQPGRRAVVVGRRAGGARGRRGGVLVDARRVPGTGGRTSTPAGRGAGRTSTASSTRFVDVRLPDVNVAEGADPRRPSTLAAPSRRSSGSATASPG